MLDQNLKILTILGTRPEVIKVFPVLKELKSEMSIESISVSTSQHREMIDDLFELFAVKPEYDLNIITKNQTLTEIANLALAGLDPILKRLKPQMVLVQGDTSTAFTGALAGFYHRIPVGHVEAGLRSFNKMHPYPEEINRKMISTISDLHFAPTRKSAEVLLNEGADSDKVVITGNTVIDTLRWVTNRGRNDFKRCFFPEMLKNRRLILVTAHRRENWGVPLENLCLGLKELVAQYPDIQIIFPVHPNPNVRETVYKILDNMEKIHLAKPLPYQAFVDAMLKSYLIITDSGGIQEEGLYLKKPILVFRQVTERTEGLESGGVKLIGLERDNLVSEASRLLSDTEAHQAMVTGYNPYGDGHAAKRIVAAIKHYFGRADRPEDFRPEKRAAARRPCYENKKVSSG